jgi:hypothetical protein
MNTGARVGLALTAGYVLGRSHKVKWALAVAALAGRGRLPGGSGGLLQHGAKLLTSSPELTKLTDEMRGRLVDAGKAAAVAAVSSKINSLSDELRERTDAMHGARAAGNGGAAGDEENVEDERNRDEDRAAERDVRHREKDRDADSEPRRDRDEYVDGRDQSQRVPAPRGESNRARASRQSRSRERSTADDRAGHPSRHDREGNGAHRESAGRQPTGEGRSRPRSTTSRTGGDSE